jgi:hypothetical protein
VTIFIADLYEVSEEEADQVKSSTHYEQDLDDEQDELERRSPLTEEERVAIDRHLADDDTSILGGAQ